MKKINMTTEIMITDNYDGEGYTTFDYASPDIRPSWEYQKILRLYIDDYIAYNYNCVDELDYEYLVGDDYLVESVTLTTSIDYNVLAEYTYDLSEWSTKDLVEHFVNLNEKALFELGVDNDKIA